MSQAASFNVSPLSFTLVREMKKGTVADGICREIDSKIRICWPEASGRLSGREVSKVSGGSNRTGLLLQRQPGAGLAVFCKEREGLDLGSFALLVS